MTKGKKPDIPVTSKTKFASPPTITFTGGPKQVDARQFLEEMKKLGIDVRITEAQISALQRASPRVLEWIALSRANLEQFATNPKKALEKIQPGLSVPTTVQSTEFKAKYRVSYPELDVAVQNLLRDVVAWAGLSENNLDKLARSPKQAIEAVAQNQPEAVVEAAIEALLQLNVSQEQPSTETVIQALRSAESIRQNRTES